MEHQEETFRMILILGFAVMLPIGLWYRLRSRVKGEKLDRRQEGLFILLTLRPVAAVSMAAFLSYLVDPSFMSWSSMSMQLPLWSRWSGVVLGIVSCSLFILTLRTLGKNLTDTVVTRKKHTLVTSGPYRWVRHPFYVAFFLAVMSNSLVTANWFIALTAGIAFVLIVLRTRKEEEYLIRRFGEDYLAYMERTPRFFPRKRRP